MAAAAPATSASTALLNHGKGVSYGKNSESLSLDRDRISQLERTSRMRRTLSKVGGFFCLPCSVMYCTAFYTTQLMCNEPKVSFSRDPTTKTHYSDFTICSAGICWKPKLPPDGKCDLVCTLLCDPCCCCVCCNEGTAEQFLLEPERQRMEISIATLKEAGEQINEDRYFAPRQIERVYPEFWRA